MNKTKPATKILKCLLVLVLALSCTGGLIVLQKVYADTIATLTATSVTVKDAVIRGGVQINKTDIQTGTTPQGAATFEHTTIQIVNESAHAVYVEGTTYNPGEVVKTMEVTLDSTTGLYVAKTSADCLPYGSYYVRESTAPQGYTNMGSIERHFQIRDEGVIVDLTSTPIQNYVQRGGVQVRKTDSDLGDASQGGATLEGATLEIVTRNDNPVFVDGVSYTKGQACKTITVAYDSTKSQYIASCTDSLPYGQYEIHEKAAPTGYKLNSGWTRNFTISYNSQVVDLTTDADVLVDDIRHGGVRVQDNDLELQKSEAIGGANHAASEGPNLIGAEFTIVNENSNTVVVNGTKYEPGAIIETIKTRWDSTLGAYVADTPTSELPYGTYSIQETATTTGYLLTDGTARTFLIREDGAIVTTNSSGQALTFNSQVMRNDIELTKIAQDTNKPMQVAFSITNVTTGESHVLVTDKNGNASTAASWNKHSTNTNANDKLLTAESINVADFDTSAGIWFGLAEDGDIATANDTVSALPYGHYTFKELRSDSNKGYDLIERDVYISRDSTTSQAVSMALSDNPSERIGTTATDTDDGNHCADADSSVTITDTVYCENLKTDGRSYTLNGTLMLKSTGEALTNADGNPITATKTFTPKVSVATQELSFTFDGSQLVGDSVVVYEDLVANSEVVATHSDLTDTDQTVRLVRIGTTATNATNNEKVVSGGEATINDDVAYEGLETNKEYTLKATLMDAETGASVKTSDQSAEITSEAKFTTDSANGIQTVTLKPDVSELSGHRLVVFEELYDPDGVQVAKHSDLSDEGQSVRVDNPVIAAVSSPATFLSNFLPQTNDRTKLIVIVALVAVAGIAGITLAIARHRKRNKSVWD